MTRDVEARFRAVLRWYPRAWREQNGEVLVATMLDAAEAEGRTAPSASDHGNAALHGTAARIDRRLALGASIAALVLSIVAGVLFVWLLPAPAGLEWLLPVLTTAVVPVLAAIGLIAFLRDRGLLADGNTLLLIVLSACALTFGALAALSWSQGFDDADAGVTPTGFAAAWLPLTVTGFVLGAGAIAVLVDALLRRTTLAAGVRLLLALVSGAFVAPVIGLSLLTPYAGALVALGVTVVASLPRRRGGPPAPRFAPAPRPTAAPRTAIRSLALISVAAGVVGVVYAFSGSLWSPWATDGTIAMAQGIMLLLASAVPLLVAVGLLMAARGRVRALHVWGPIAAATVALAFLIVAYTQSPSWDGMAPGIALSSAFGGIAIAWWTVPRIRLSRPAAALIGVSSGLIYAAFLGMLVAPMLAFTVPVLAILVAVLGGRRPRVVREIRVHVAV
ncbi:hypothetical protein MN032_05695 [Agromyces atrinae]|uniref:hypothetical protein n=1 Tax=Agromyces atrinae TaxID=592376 RepID=UPI001F5899E4|nr:hypothetical protein [Agromyces atrinae]MCI2957178.1 hypothetical protein [Agromyces atrinae]